MSSAHGMVPIHVAEDEIELAFIRAALKRDSIFYFIQGEFYGSVNPGVQIPSMNQRRIHVHANQFEQAQEIIQDVLDVNARRHDHDYAATSKLRMIFETFFFGWFFPGGRRDPDTPRPFSPWRNPRHTAVMLLIFLLLLASFTLSISISAAADTENNTVKVGVPPWQGAEIKSAVVTEILTALGYRVKTTSAAAPLIFQELAEGRLDINLSAWVPGQDQAFQPYVDEGRIVILGENLSGALTGLAVPAGVHADGLDSLQDLDAMKEAFDATIHCIEPGSGAMIVAGEAIDNDIYDLGDWTLLPSSTQAMLAQVGRAIRRDEPIVFCAWKPHWMNVAYGLHFLEDPRNHWGEAGQTRVYTLARSGFADDHPDLAVFFERFRIDSAVQSAWIHAYAREERPARKVARAWLAGNFNVVAGWLEGIKALDGRSARTVLRESLAL